MSNSTLSYGYKVDKHGRVGKDFVLLSVGFLIREGSEPMNALDNLLSRHTVILSRILLCLVVKYCLFFNLFSLFVLITIFSKWTDVFEKSMNVTRST